jgi:Flp pilus assembly pilin Flp
MSKIKCLLYSIIIDETAQDLIEYSLLLCFLALAAIGILPALGNTINQIFSRTNSTLLGGATGS